MINIGTILCCRLLGDAVVNFQTTQEEVTIIVNPEKFVVKNYTEDEPGAIHVSFCKAALYVPIEASKPYEKLKENASLALNLSVHAVIKDKIFFKVGISDMTQVVSTVYTIV